MYLTGISIAGVSQTTVFETVRRDHEKRAMQRRPPISLDPRDVEGCFGAAL